MNHSKGYITITCANSIRVGGFCVYCIQPEVVSTGMTTTDLRALARKLCSVLVFFSACLGCGVSEVLSP